MGKSHGERARVQPLAAADMSSSSDADPRSGSAGYAALVRAGSRDASRRDLSRMMQSAGRALRAPLPPLFPGSAPASSGRRSGQAPGTRAGGAGPSDWPSLRDADDEPPPPGPAGQPQPLPSRWELPMPTVTASGGAERDEQEPKDGHLKVGPGLRVKYVGPGQSDNDAANILVRPAGAHAALPALAAYVRGLSASFCAPLCVRSCNQMLRASNAQADKPVPRDQPVYCFEVEIINKGANGYIGM